jgi:hypothetical protein
MLRPHGTGVIVDPGAPQMVREIDGVMCCHCQRITFVKPGQSASDVGGFCGMCYAPTCEACHQKGVCVPFEAKLEMLEGKRAFYRGIEIIGEPK